MAYRNFTLDAALEAFDLDEIEADFLTSQNNGTTKHNTPEN